MSLTIKTDTCVKLLDPGIETWRVMEMLEFERGSFLGLFVLLELGGKERKKRDIE